MRTPLTAKQAIDQRRTIIEARRILTLDGVPFIAVHEGAHGYPIVMTIQGYAHEAANALRSRGFRTTASYADANVLIVEPITWARFTAA